MSSPSSSSPSSSASTPCPTCGTPGSGHFCAECGTPLQQASCQSCGSPLTPGAKFCHHCGTQVSARASQSTTPASGNSSLATTLPWAVAGIAFLALFAMLAGKGLNTRRGSAVDAPQNALPNPTVDAPNASPMSGTGTGTSAEAPNGGAAGGATGGIRAPDISNMNPQEIAERLYNRIMALDARGKRDSVQFFAPMAMQAYQMLEQQQGHPLTAEQRARVKRIAELAGLQTPPNTQ